MGAWREQGRVFPRPRARGPPVAGRAHAAPRRLRVPDGERRRCGGELEPRALAPDRAKEPVASLVCEPRIAEGDLLHEVPRDQHRGGKDDALGDQESRPAEEIVAEGLVGPGKPLRQDDLAVSATVDEARGDHREPVSRCVRPELRARAWTVATRRRRPATRSRDCGPPRSRRRAPLRARPARAARRSAQSPRRSGAPPERWRRRGRPRRR